MTWRSKEQNVVARSSANTEFRAFSQKLVRVVLVENCSK